MSYYKYIDIPNWEVTAQELHKYVTENYEEKFSDHTNAFYWVDYNILLKEAPSLQSILDYFNATIFFTAFHITHGDCSPIHIDLGEKKSRINIPILNCKNTSTVFYTCSEYDIMEQSNGVVYKACKPEHCIEVDRVTLDRPMIIKVYEPHNIEVPSNVYPRISFTMHLNEPIEHWYD